MAQPCGAVFHFHTILWTLRSWSEPHPGNTGSPPGWILSPVPTLQPVTREREETDPVQQGTTAYGAAGTRTLDSDLSSAPCRMAGDSECRVRGTVELSLHDFVREQRLLSFCLFNTVSPLFLVCISAIRLALSPGRDQRIARRVLLNSGRQPIAAASALWAPVMASLPESSTSLGWFCFPSAMVTSNLLDGRCGARLGPWVSACAGFLLARERHVQGV